MDVGWSTGEDLRDSVGEIVDKSDERGSDDWKRHPMVLFDNRVEQLMRLMMSELLIYSGYSVLMEHDEDEEVPTTHLWVLGRVPAGR